jgi:hypothetical protein
MIRPKASTGQESLGTHISENPTLGSTTATPYGSLGGALNSGSTIYSGTTTSGFHIPITGTFLVVSIFTGAATTVPTWSVGANMVRVNLLNNDTVGFISTVSGGSACTVQCIRVNQGGVGAPNFLVVTGGLTGLTGGTADTFIVRISPDLMFKPQQEGIRKMFDAFLRQNHHNHSICDNSSLDSPVIVEEHKEQPTGITSGLAPVAATPSRYRMF